jgi:hypothetical protein
MRTVAVLTVGELIEKLQKVDKNTPVEVWDPYLDCGSYNVVVTKTTEGDVHIGNVDFGDELL